MVCNVRKNVLYCTTYLNIPKMFVAGEQEIAVLERCSQMFGGMMSGGLGPLGGGLRRG